MEENSKSQLMAMTIIANAGEGRSLGFAALGKAKEGEFGLANELLTQAQSALNKAHKAQSELLFAEASGEAVETGILMIHAQDHLMTSMLGVELIEELIQVYQGRLT